MFKMTTAKNISTIFIGLIFVACNNAATENKSPGTTNSIKTVSVDSFYIDQNEVTSDYKVYDEKIR